ncbi:acetyl esterase [Plectosphaerella plurivora]|uniref:Acetyl esterase n=1 Tax=Plectosphaerella plurivora TaxID=936078 RepID=A0A9P8V5I0_9PEZI|nr:acetyl esterase [Plectosphaerella plurivora]
MRSLATLALASVAAASSCGLRKLENLVSFGDSWTDTGRLGYFGNNNGNAPPAGVPVPESSVTATGGLAWGQFVANETGARYYNYAVSGAVTSDDIITRAFRPNLTFPSVLDYQVPAFEADIAAGTLFKDRKADNTLYALWIGTNDLGWNAMLSDSQIAGATISTFVDSIWTIFDHIYAAGGRHFVLFNLAPLEEAPLYASIPNGGVGDSVFWTNKTSYNTTEYENKMLQYTTSANTLFDYGVPFQLVVRKRWPGAKITLYDVHTLMREIHAEPEKYLTEPANVKDVYHVCNPANWECVDPSPNPPSSFMWYDELHHSERTAEIIAENFVSVVQGKSPYATTYSGR